MDFDRLPNEIFLHILQLLPFKERIRIARVSRQFKMISETAISLTEGLNLTAAIFREAKWKSMKKLFRCCAANQKKVIVDFTHSSRGRDRSEMLERLRLFTNISHPRLEIIELDTRNGTETEHDYNMVRDLLVNNTNIRSLSWCCPNGPFPNVLCEKLESVTLEDICLNEHTYFAWITDYCPNVKSLVLIFGLNWGASDEILQQWQEILNNIFWNTPSMQSLELWAWNIDLLEIENVWKLAFLRTLILRGIWVSVPVLEKISATFPQLENFEFWSDRPMPIEGASALQRLKNLRWVSMGMRDRSTKDAYALQLAKCHRLQFVLINESTQSPIVAAFVNGCPQLRVLVMWKMTDIDSPETAISFVKSLDGFVQENLKIATNGEVWKNADVQAAVAEINKSKGHQISIKTEFSSFESFRQPYRPPTAECTRDRISLNPPYCPSLWQRLIWAIRDLRKKIANMCR